MSNHCVPHSSKVSSNALLHTGVGQTGLSGGRGEGAKGGSNASPHRVHPQNVGPVTRVDRGESLEGSADNN